MDKKKVEFVRCVFLPENSLGGRPFVIRFDDGGELRGTVSVEFCYDRDGEPLGKTSANPGEIEGFVPGIRLGHESNGELRMYLPDGEVYLVDDDLIEPVRFAGETADVSVK